MGTKIRPELSKTNKYWIEKHRYYELKHFCLQYPIWKKAKESLCVLQANQMGEKLSNDISDKTSRIAIALASYDERIRMVERACKESDDLLWAYILLGVTEELSYVTLQMKYNIPCCKDTYYDRYRKFFYILNKLRD